MTSAVKVVSSSVSSVLQRNNKEHGKKFLFDGCPDTAWSSDGGEKQQVSLKLEQQTNITKIKIQVMSRSYR